MDTHDEVVARLVIALYERLEPDAPLCSVRHLVVEEIGMSMSDFFALTEGRDQPAAIRREW